MSVVVGAVVGSTLLSAYSANRAASSQEKAMKEGAKVNKQISDESLLLQRDLADQQRADLEPWRKVGEEALGQVWAGINDGSFDVGEFDITQDPSYQFRMSEGLKALDNAASATGMSESGAQNKAIQRYAQNLASTEYANAYARDQEAKNRRFNMLSGMSGTGQNAAAGQAATTAQLANASQNILANQAATQQNAIVGVGNAKASGYANMAAAANQGVENYLTYKKL